MLATKNKVYLLLQDEWVEWINTFAEFELIIYSDDEIGTYNINCTLKPNTYLGNLVRDKSLKKLKEFYCTEHRY